MIPCVGRVVLPSGAVPLASSVHDDFSAKARPVVAARARCGRMGPGCTKMRDASVLMYARIGRSWSDHDEARDTRNR
jgi:hypothetical protein